MTTLDVVIPVYNEEHVLANSVGTLRDFLQKNMASYQWTIVIANNASTDRTLDVAKELSQKYPDVRYVHLDQKGRGRALRKSWLESPSNILCYMDVDLSTDLKHLPPLIGAISSGYDVAIGSRLSSQSNIRRSLKREITSRGYNLMIRAMFFTRFSDAQCGFKAVSRKAAQALVPLIENQELFFDTELLILAEKKGFRVWEVPVEWIEDPDTRVNIVETAKEDIRGLLRMRFKAIP